MHLNNSKDFSNMAENKNVVIYCRVSSLTDRQNTERQVVDLTYLANQKGMTIAKVFEEHISGSKKNVDRPVLTQCLSFCKNHHIKNLFVSELSRLGRNTFEVLSTVKDLMECGINVYFQKEQISLFDEDGKVGVFVPILIAVLGTCAELERENIKFRLNSGLSVYKSKGGKVGRRVGSIKSVDVMKEEYKEAISLLKRGYSIRNTAKLTNKSVSTIQKVKKEFVKKDDLQ